MRSSSRLVKELMARGRASKARQQLMCSFLRALSWENVSGKYSIACRESRVTPPAERSCRDLREGKGILLKLEATQAGFEIRQLSGTLLFSPRSANPSEIQGRSGCSGPDGKTSGGKVSRGESVQAKVREVGESVQVLWEDSDFGACQV